MENGSQSHDQQALVHSPRQWRLDHRLWWNAITIAGLLYLVGIALNLPIGHFGQTEAIVFAAILILNPALVEAFFERVKSLSVSSKGVEVSLQEVKEKQNEQAKVLETLAFLLANYLPEPQLEFFFKIAGTERDDSYQLNDGKSVRERLRKLRDAKLVRKIDPGYIQDLPEQGHLRDFFVLTDRGRKYLELVTQVGVPQGTVTTVAPTDGKVPPEVAAVEN
jgi:hypothetical protein